MKKRIFLCLAAAVFIQFLPAEEKTAPVSLEDQRRETLRYGTENEIIDLIQALKNENADYLDGELASVIETTKNGKILSGVFTFFADREKPGLEKRAMAAVEYWDEETNDSVIAAIDYLGKVKAEEATDPLIDIINSNESRFMNNAFRALGRIGSASKDESDFIADYLIDFYDQKNPTDENMREIIVALGELGNRKGTAFLAEIAGNNDERATRRMAALGALSKIGDSEGLPAVIKSLQSSDPNVRAAAVAALGPFAGDEVETAILEAFRDSYYRTRIGAAQAASERKMTAAVPYLKYRAERDDVPAVKDEAIKALGAINTSETSEILSTLFFNRKNSDRVRLVAGEMLIKNDPDAFAERFIAELDEAKTKNQTPLYNGLSRIIAQAETKKVEDLALRFLTAGGVVEKSYAIDMAVKNKLTSLGNQIKELTDPKNGSLSRKARDALDKLGIPYSDAEPD
ncbi:HEAT repeat domain-containing protein [Breznakiella homolactica]|uniref:HEAT repeat domain-containing protein n=1 Tax=Breznakiella homolactica TaxID=2798577 RepID=A0A7T8B9C1_9SPIR|nr:HEAT repeat domain-containing protein [Breznakiella homolactica]QQO08181.1 HEAT repeat domain-containing protein [Breznakiella homolactica]